MSIAVALDEPKPTFEPPPDRGVDVAPRDPIHRSVVELFIHGLGVELQGTAHLEREIPTDHDALAQYILRSPFPQEKMAYRKESQTVL